MTISALPAVSRAPDGLPYLIPPVFRTVNGTRYLKAPGVAMIAAPHTDLYGVRGFLAGFDAVEPSFEFSSYLEDPTLLPDAERLVKFAGQVCYLSLGTGRTTNADAAKYLTNIKASGHGCYDIETEVLTWNGWKAWPDVTEDDALATRTPEGILEYHKPTRLIQYEHTGRMYRVETQGVDLLVTPDHRMLVCPTTTVAGRRREDFRLITAEELGHRSHAYIKSATWLAENHALGSTDAPITGDVLALLGFAIGDGTMSRSDRELEFHLRRERKIAWLRATHQRLGWGALREYPARDKYHILVPEAFVPLFRGIYNDNKEKIIPQWIINTASSSLLLRLFEGLMQADGHRGRTSDMFDTTSHRLAGQFQQLCLHIGLAANVTYTYDSEQRPTSYGSKPLIRLGIIRRGLKPEANRFIDSVGKTSWINDWSGDVFCAEVPNNTLYVRRNGIPVWSGNSVLEHANFSFLFWGIDRSVTHELVRHRAGWAFSQLSQRFVDSSRLRFVERPEYQAARIPGAGIEVHQLVTRLHDEFEVGIERAAAHYETVASSLIRARELGHPLLQGGAKTELRKQVNQTARESLPNCTEAPIVVTANVRAWRHFLEMRANQAAEVQIRALAMLAYTCLRMVAPILFDDYRVIDVGDTGTLALETDYRKV